MNKKLFLAAIALMLGFSTIGIAKAQSSGILISPVTLNFNLKAGETKESKVLLKNQNSTELQYVLEIENFSNVNDDGAPSFAGATSQQGVTTLADWITPLESKEGTIPANGEKEIKFKVDVPVGAEPGGHYAAIFAKEIKKAADGKTEIGVATRVGTLMLVSVPGNVTKTAEITDFKSPKFVWSGPVKLSGKVTNTGTVHYDSTFKVNFTSLVNTTSEADLGKHTILPKMSRNYEGEWNKKYPFGRYVVTAVVNDGAGTEITTNSVLWAVPIAIVIPALIGLAILIMIIVYLRRHVKLV